MAPSSPSATPFWHWAKHVFSHFGVRDTLQYGPDHLFAHSHTPSLQTPLPEQFLGHDLSEQSAVCQPSLQTHSPWTHFPRPEQPCGQGTRLLPPIANISRAYLLQVARCWSACILAVEFPVAATTSDARSFRSSANMRLTVLSTLAGLTNDGLYTLPLIMAFDKSLLRASTKRRKKSRSSLRTRLLGCLTILSFTYR